MVAVIHLRVRFHGAPARLHGELLPRLEAALAPLFADGRAHRLVLDTYGRETERYGGDAGIELAEELFRHDSDSALELIELLDGEDEDFRWRLVFAGLDRLLGDFGLELEQRIELLLRVRAGFAREHHADATLERQIGERYRKERLELEKLLVTPHDPEHPLAPGLAVFDRRTERLRPVATALVEAATRGGTSTTSELAEGVMHMHCNRLLRSAARKHELVLYDLLLRAYESRRARQRKTPS